MQLLLILLPASYFFQKCKASPSVRYVFTTSMHILNGVQSI